MAKKQTKKERLFEEAQSEIANATGKKFRANTVTFSEPGSPFERTLFSIGMPEQHPIVRVIEGWTRERDGWMEVIYNVDVLENRPKCAEGSTFTVRGSRRKLRGEETKRSDLVEEKE